MKIGEKVKEGRKAKGMTQEDLATILNVSRQTISAWELGRAYPDLQMVVKICDLFNISLDTLLREDIEIKKHLSYSNEQKEKAKLKIRLLKQGYIYLSLLLVQILMNFWVHYHLENEAIVILLNISLVYTVVSSVYSFKNKIDKINKK